MPCHTLLLTMGKQDTLQWLVTIQLAKFVNEFWFVLIGKILGTNWMSTFDFHKHWGKSHFEVNLIFFRCEKKKWNKMFVFYGITQLCQCNVVNQSCFCTVSKLGKQIWQCAWHWQTAALIFVQPIFTSRNDAFHCKIASPAVPRSHRKFTCNYFCNLFSISWNKLLTIGNFCFLRKPVCDKPKAKSNAKGSNFSWFSAFACSFGNVFGAHKQGQRELTIHFADDHVIVVWWEFCNGSLELFFFLAVDVVNLVNIQSEESLSTQLIFCIETPK